MSPISILPARKLITSLSYADMQKLALKAKVTEGYTTYENSANTQDIKKWITDLNL